MKLRRIAVNNLRRFTAPVEITGLSEGLNVLAAPNEQGKSTLFDGLQALFRFPHSGKPREITALRPHAGGAPEVLVDIETDEGVFTVAKRWISKPRATIHRDGHLIAQADEAEAWISRLSAADAGGPSGLLWVRQGLTVLSDGTRKDQDLQRDARRDLLSSVTGEVEAMTGGQRMDAALKHCRAELENYATATGRPRTGGPWKTAQDRVEALRTQHEEMAQTVAALQDDLSARKRARTELHDLTDPETAERRKSRLMEATAAFAAAERHAARIDTLIRAVDTAQLQLDGLLTRKTALAEARAEQVEATQQAQAARDQRGTADQTQAEAQANTQTARDTLTAARATLAEAERALQAAQNAERAKDTSRQRAELADRLTKAEALRDTADTARAAATTGPTAEHLTDLERKAAALEQARALRDASAAKLEITYEPGRDGSIHRDGTALPGAIPIPLITSTDLQIDGIGNLRFAPGGKGDDGSVDAAQDALDTALRKLGVDDIAGARAAAETRARAERAVAEASAALKAHAPKGLDALHDALAALPVPPEDSTTDLPPLEEAKEARNAAEAFRIEAETALETARDRLDLARTEAARAQAAGQAAKDRLTRADAALSRIEPISDADLATELAQAEVAFADAQTACAKAKAEAPDLESTRAALTRAQSAERAAEDNIARLTVDLARLDERVRRNAEGAVEERLEELEQDLKAAEASLARMAREVAVLQRLAAALEAARSAARDRYFTPVANALRPLLHLLWPEAQLEWDDTDLLPRQLIRNGREETVDVLSGGTQEQLALLVRLAFARLLAQDGRAAPVILDDALVYTDDDRIERMFDALHRQAADVQIIVLTCRQRAFRDLGGQQLSIRPLSLTSDSLLDV
ncbi:chromosome segregation protein [Antarctobacter heliothermus]|uniref:Chromosome segregation protein n=1 Tax=Antarctobacter heliothermus TaxID=74033 RepID=A0A222E7B6_9RHOB|nr:hypothetical protein [Antarctobacter heliothermus]ASP22097.1 chromosome segregation protein [Antarctobacter heliothermus]